MTDRIKDEYYAWIVKKIDADRFSEENSYSKLLEHLYKTEFTYTVKNDRNRASDGIGLRYRFSISNKEREKHSDEILYILSGPCSVLEMLIALSIRCEEGIMDDPEKGDRTGQWFWGMIANLGLGSMADERYDEKEVDNIIHKFLKHKYEPDGKGGLFTIRNCKKDLRKVEIWKQLCWYLDTIM